MLLKYVYDERLAHASYFVGCQAMGKAVVIDPGRDVEPYLQVAQVEGMEIVGALETHIHADFVSGSRELAERVGATMYVSAEGGEDWAYQNLSLLPHRLVKDGDQIKIGNLTFSVIHTPGHTPESISFMLTDAGTTEPIGIFTGDFVFVGDVGRPDLLEKAAGMKGTATAGAYAMYRSLEKFKALPDYMQVWPAHGAGSACGKALGAVPSSTVGYEKRVNWALQYDDPQVFVRDLINGQPEPPKYFSIMKQVNKAGHNIVRDLPEPGELVNMSRLLEVIESGAQVIDTREPTAFAKAHLEGTLNIPFNKTFTNWAGWIIDYERPLHLLADPAQLDEIVKALRSIGIDRVVSFMNVEEAIKLAPRLESYDEITPLEAAGLIESGEVDLIDVRHLSEWQEGHIEGATHIMLGQLLDRVEEVSLDRPIIVQCRSGFRSAIGASILQANGRKNVRNLTGGILRWNAEVGRTEREVKAGF